MFALLRRRQCTLGEGHPRRSGTVRCLLSGLVLILVACGSEGNPLADT